MDEIRVVHSINIARMNNYCFITFCVYTDETFFLFVHISCCLQTMMLLLLKWKLLLVKHLLLLSRVSMQQMSFIQYKKCCRYLTTKLLKKLVQCSWTVAVTLVHIYSLPSRLTPFTFITPFIFQYNIFQTFHPFNFLYMTASLAIVPQYDSCRQPSVFPSSNLQMCCIWEGQWSFVYICKISNVMGMGSLHTHPHCIKLPSANRE